MSQEQMLVLEAKINELIGRVEQLQLDKQNLLEREEKWHQERGRLVEKNELAKSRVEAMISRLRSLESEA
ncbi:TIGR02449 family protein [Marinibactrum halimedae]|uniref:TIGR02449 family protein n=1 Tax=Marinibactrum halimedae TaxID=1444977 RepID=A0AA37WND2_9GAMM|nr:TIGR02449 family protein [Marinibactrum halimedae]MCD9457720.1 TIGR02449 family protein [Marinibactrum halimedae]GLS24907.1 hypothetical protein GCM10007877_06210 [Marinibactrum halimedae]